MRTTNPLPQPTNPEPNPNHTGGEGRTSHTAADTLTDRKSVV